MDDHLDVQSISVKAQKKILGKFTSRKVISTFIDDISKRILDNMYRLAKDFSDKKTAEKVMKHLIKTIIKIGILYKNDQFNQEELDVAENFKKKFNSLMMTIVSFIQVDFTYDRDFLISNMNECKQLLKQLVVRHLTEKSLLRIESFFAFFLNEGILDASFRPNGPHRGVLDKIAEDLSTLLENGVI